MHNMTKQNIHGNVHIKPLSPDPTKQSHTPNQIGYV